MKNMLICFLCCTSLFLTLVSAQKHDGMREIKIAASSIPHAEILNFITPKLKMQGIKLHIMVTDNPTFPNMFLHDKSVDANFFQTLPYLEEQSRAKGYDFVSVASVHIEPLGLYSKKIKNIKSLEKGAIIAIPNNIQNSARALILLHNAGLITLKDSHNFVSNEYDIIKNPKRLKFKYIDPPLLPRILDDVDAAIINGNYALLGGLRIKEALIIEEAKDSPYANIVVVRRGDETKEEILKIKDALHSNELRAFIVEKYQGDIIPTF